MNQCVISFAMFTYLLLLFVGLVSAQTDYCNLCEDHTMCIYGEGNTNGNIKFRGVTRQSDIDAILNAHNNYRRNVAAGNEQRGDPGPQPPASNMQDMTWDDELATVAQRWADQCNFGHDHCRKVERFGWVGQNVFLKSLWSSDGIVPDDYQEWNIAIEAFYEEVKSLDNRNVEHFASYPSKNETYHYTQVVWAKSNLIGCGFTAYTERADGKDWYKKYYVCNYGPGGNIVGDPIYEIAN